MASASCSRRLSHSAWVAQIRFLKSEPICCSSTQISFGFSGLAAAAGLGVGAAAPGCARLRVGGGQRRHQDQAGEHRLPPGQAEALAAEAFLSRAVHPGHRC
jgi:hypothetical protein